MTATRQSWSNLKSLPDQYALLALQREFTEQEYARICRGFIPRGMEDRWFIYIEGDTLYMHRSWTGYCIYQLCFLKTDTGYAIGEICVNRDPSQYSYSDDHYDEKLLTALLENLLLGGHAPLPMAPHVPAGIATDLHLLHVAGVSHKEEEQPQEPSISSIWGWLWRWLLWLIKG
ncbi:MAG: hypothetical protein KDJ52_13070 [Anaerolineae bacterium]|nr:hypothetical protein [Anaerolineae bacterium]